jgi:hypothetical protein
VASAGVRTVGLRSAPLRAPASCAAVRSLFPSADSLAQRFLCAKTGASGPARTVGPLFRGRPNAARSASSRCVPARAPRVPIGSGPARFPILACSRRLSAAAWTGAAQRVARGSGRMRTSVRCAGPICTALPSIALFRTSHDRRKVPRPCPCRAARPMLERCCACRQPRGYLRNAPREDGVGLHSLSS